MSLYTVVRQGFNSYNEALAYTQKQGYGRDEIRGETPRTDVIDKASGAFVARDISEYEAQEIQKGNESYMRTPAGQYNDESVRNISYAPDRGSRQSPSSQAVQDTGTGNYARYDESTQ